MRAALMPTLIHTRLRRGADASGNVASAPRLNILPSSVLSKRSLNRRALASESRDVEIRLNGQRDQLDAMSPKPLPRLSPLHLEPA